MSLFRPMNLRCPGCGATVNASVAGSINADRRPDLRQAILENTFQDFMCDVCKTRFRCECDLNYIDMGRSQWIAALPARQMADHLEEEVRALEAFDGSFGPQSSDVAQAIGRSLAVRVVFGWAAFREKLLARELEMDDVALECLKLDLLRRLPDVPMRPGVELRLDRQDGQLLTLVWVVALTEEVIESVTVDRALLDAISGTPDAWAAVRADLSMGPFVDMQRLYMGPGRAERVGPHAA